MNRPSKMLLGAVIVGSAGLAHALLFDDPYTLSYVPKTTAGWISYYFFYSLPWMLVGTVVFGFFGKRTKKG